MDRKKEGEEEGDANASFVCIQKRAKRRRKIAKGEEEQGD